VRVDHTRASADLLFLVRHDSDAFCRWEASQRLLTEFILARIAAARDAALERAFVVVARELLSDDALDGSLLAQLLRIPDVQTLGNAMDEIDIDGIDRERTALAAELAGECRDLLLQRYTALGSSLPYAPDPASIARRAARNLCLDWLLASDDPAAPDLAVAQLECADNITDALAALTALANRDCPQRVPATDAFRARWQHDRGVINKWLFVAATSRLPGTVAHVAQLIADPAINVGNPSVSFALLGGFMRRNYVQFHAADGSGYQLFREVILRIDSRRPESVFWFMPQIMRWRRFDARRRELMAVQLRALRATAGISGALTELLDRALGDTAG